MKIIYASQGADLEQIKALGFDTVLGDFAVDSMNRMLELGLYNIPRTFIEHPVVVAYYLYDEPDVSGTSIADQETKIAWFRARTKLPLAIAIIEEVERKCSRNFDWYMQDIYYSNKLSKLKNYLNIAISSHLVKVLYKGNRVFPIVGLYDDKDPFVFSNEILPFARKFRSYFRNNDHAVFIWKGSPPVYYGVADRPIYSNWAQELNSTDDRCWWLTSATLYALAWCIIKINPYLGKYKIVI